MKYQITLVFTDENNEETAYTFNPMWVLSREEIEMKAQDLKTHYGARKYEIEEIL